MNFTFSAAGGAIGGERLFNSGWGGSLAMRYNLLVMDCDHKLRIIEPLAWRRFVASFLLWVFLVATTPLAPMLTVLMGMVDRSHHVALQPTVNGLQVVLRHDCPGSSTHRHGLVARALTLLAQRPSGAQPDHVIQFAACPPAEQPPAVIPASRFEETGPKFCFVSETLICSFWRTPTPAGNLRPPSQASDVLWRVRPVVLLI